METIYEQRIESPVMMTSGHQRFVVHGRNIANTGKPIMAPVLPLSPADSVSSQSPTSPSLAKKPSKTMRDWVKRSGSGSGSGRPTKHIATLSAPGHQRLPIVHLGGGRLGELDIEPAFSTGHRPMARNPSIQRESSADSRVTQWIDLYPEAIDRMNGYDARLTQGKHTRAASESSTVKQTRWKFHPDHHAAAPPEIDARPAPLRIPSAKKKAVDDDALKEAKTVTGKATSLARSDSKWKPLPILPAQQQVAAGGVGSQNNHGKHGGGNGMPARKPLQVPSPQGQANHPPERHVSADATTRPQTPKRHETNPALTRKPDPSPPLPVAIYITPPPTPDSDIEPASKTETASRPPALRINTSTRAGSPSPPSTICLVPDSNSAPKPQLAFELAAEEPTTSLAPSLVSPLTTTTQSDSLLSTDLDDAFKITIGMMCLNELDLNLGASGSGSGGSSGGGSASSQSHQAPGRSRPELQVGEQQHTAKSAPPLDDSSVLVTDLDSPLAYVPRLFSPRGGSPVGEMATSGGLARDLGIESPLAGSVAKSAQKDRQELRCTVVTAAAPATTVFSPSTPTTTSTAAAAAGRTSSSSSAAKSRPSPTPLALKSPPAHSPQTAHQDNLSQTPPPPPASTTSRYTRAERIWLHQHYRGEAPFLRAWGLDIKNPADRDEGMVVLRELMLSED